MTQFITGTFSEAAPANSAVADLIASGRARDDISIIMNGDTYHRFWDKASAGQTTGSNATRGASGTATAGKAIETILAEAARRDASAMSGVRAGLPDRFVVAGPAAAVLRDGGDEPSGAGMIQRLARLLGMPRHDAEQLGRDVGSGAIAVGVKASDGERAAIERILLKYAAKSVIESLTAS